MKTKHFLFGLFAAVALAGCSSDDTVTTDNGTVSDGEARYLTVNIATSNGSTRAGGDQAGELELYEEGFPNENEVASVRFYFFDTDGAAATVKADGTNYYDWNPADNTNAEIAMPNVEKKLHAVIVINTEKGDKLPASMVAVVNPVGLPTGNQTLAALQGIIGTNDAYATTDKFLMTSSVYKKGSEVGCEVTIDPAKLCTTEALALANPVDVYVERILAKVRLYTAWDENTTTTTKGLVQAKDAKGNAITDGEGHNIYVKFIGWNLTNTATSSYLFKNVNPAWDESKLFGTGNSWNDASNFRSYWAMNPTNLKLNNSGNTYSSITEKIGTKTTTSSDNLYDGDVFYCLENAADSTLETGAKKWYNPNKSLSNRTQVILAAQLVDENGEAISLAEWAGQKYTEIGVKTAMLNQVVNILYTKTSEGNNDVYASITADAVKLATASEAGKADSDAQGSKRYLSYLQLAASGESKSPYYKKNADGTYTQQTYAAVNQILSDVPGAKVWSSGQTYYYTDIQHLNQTTADDAAKYGKYGVVRNHIYDIAVTGLTGLGTPVLNPDENIIPQPVPDEYSYLAARINILSWRVVKSNVNLNW